jgi:hypothetical protein
VIVHEIHITEIEEKRMQQGPQQATPAGARDTGCGFCCVLIKSLTFKFKSYIKDTTDFLRKIKDLKTNDNDIIVAANVCGLYIRINYEGTDACKDALENRPIEEKKRMPTEVLITLLLKILRSNCFSFFGKFYLQCCGTAMGTPVEPSYVNFYMTKVENRILDEYEKRQGLRTLVWYRYLDDIIFVWQHEEQRLYIKHKFVMNTNTSI